MSTLAVKLFALWVRQISKPVSNVLKAQAKEHPLFKKVCVRLAQRMHSADIRVKQQLLGRKNPADIRPLNDAKAVENGATFLGEFFVFGVAGSIVVYETVKGARKEAKKKEALANDITALQEEIEYLKGEMKRMGAHMEEYTGRLPSVNVEDDKSSAAGAVATVATAAMVAATTAIE